LDINDTGFQFQKTQKCPAFFICGHQYPQFGDPDVIVEALGSTEERHTVKIPGSPLPGFKKINGDDPTNDGTAPVFAASNIKIPPFWRDEPDIWFLQIEASFSIAKITKDEIQYLFLIA